MFTLMHAANLMRVSRDSVASRAIRPTDHTILDYHLYRSRVPGEDRSVVSLTTMQTNLHIRREELVDAHKRLEAAGLLRKIKSWIWVVWEGVRLRRQATNVYVFPKKVIESRRRTVFPEAKKERSCPYQKTGILGARPIKDPGFPALEEMLKRLANAAGLVMPQ